MKFIRKHMVIMSLVLFLIALYFLLLRPFVDLYNSDLKLFGRNILYFDCILCFVLFVCALVFYYSRENCSGAGWLKTIDGKSHYEGLSIFDAILGHYTNVASVGLFIGLIIYGMKKIYPGHEHAILIITPLLLFAAFFVYAVLYYRVVYYFYARLNCCFLRGCKTSVNVNNRWHGFFSCATLALGVIFVDFVAVVIFIKAVPG